MIKNILLVGTCTLFIFFSCSENNSKEKNKQETPKALEDKVSTYNLVSKRGNEDLIGSLYQELVTKDSNLKKLEDKIEVLNNSEYDTTQKFNKFNNKNLAYFKSADFHISSIKDSLIREKIKNIVSAQLKKYNSKIAKHNELLKLIDTKKTSLTDLHQVLKIVKTLSLIDKFQKEKLPNIKSLENFVKLQEEVIKLNDTLTNE